MDGFLARRLKQITIFGAFLDPVADKLMVAVASCCWFRPTPRSGWRFPAAIIIGREIAISALREWMARIGEHRRVAVVMLGKFKTFCHACGHHPHAVRSADAPAEYYYRGGLGLLYAATALTLWSMVQYLAAARSLLRAEAGEGRPAGEGTRREP